MDTMRNVCLLYILLGFVVCGHAKSLMENHEELQNQREDILSERGEQMIGVGGLLEEDKMVGDSNEEIDDETIIHILEEVEDINKEIHTVQEKLHEDDEGTKHEVEDNIENEESDVEGTEEYDVADEDDEIKIDTSDEDEEDSIRDNIVIKKAGDSTLKVAFRPVSVPQEFASYDVDEDGLITLAELINVTGARENVHTAFKESDING